MRGIQAKHPLQTTQPHRGLGTQLRAQMFPIKTSTSSLNVEFQFHSSLKFLFDPSEGKSIQQKNGNEKPRVLRRAETQSGTTSLLLWEGPNSFKGVKLKSKRYKRKRIRFAERKENIV